MSQADTQELIDAATALINARYRPEWHVLAAALRLGDGTVVTGLHMDANVGRIAVCAESIAMGRAMTEHGRIDVTMIVAVRMAEDGTISVVAPCGMCREMLTDYAPDALVVMPNQATTVLVPATDLLPGKYTKEVCCAPQP